MKKRFRLLFGLGIVLTLSVTIPVFAAELPDFTGSKTVSSKELPNYADTNSDSSDKPENPTNTSSDSSDESANPADTDSDSSSETADNITAAWQQDKETEGHMDEWYLSLTDKSADQETVTHFKGTGAYKVGEKTYYFSDGYLQTGPILIEEPDTAAVETDIIPDTSLGMDKIYYFNMEGTDPSSDDLGSLVTGEAQWLIFSDEAGEQPDEWYFLTEDGEIDLTMIGIQQISDEQWIYINDDHTLAPWESGWYLIDDTAWYYLDENGSRDKTKIGYVEIEGGHYYLNEDGTPKTGIVEMNGKKYYFSEQDAGKRAMVTGWQLLDGNLLYFNSSSEIVNSGHNGWLYIFNNWYYFQNGTMKTGWVLYQNLWYYLDPETGVMETGWFKAGSSTYYADANGAMQSGWQLIDSIWYYFGDPSDGSMKTNFWLYYKNHWYYLGSDGKMLTGWQTINGKTYYLDAIDGGMYYGWVFLDSKWYYFGAPHDGSMKAGWIFEGSTWYYLDPETGIMQTGWVELTDGWYYLYESGSMAANRWVGDYYLLDNGRMATSQWIGQYWVGADGKWIPNYNPTTQGGQWIATGNTWMFQRADGSYIKNEWQKIDGEWYYFEADGKIVVDDWKYIGNYKYYFGPNGDLKQDLDGILPKQSEYEITVNRVTCQVMVYAKDSDTGKFCIPVKTFACSVGLPESPTPTGTFYAPENMRWHQLIGPSYGQYCTRITTKILFHSVASPDANNNNLPAVEFNKLGSPASHGCVRLCVRDAKWIYDNCRVAEYDRYGNKTYDGTKITINDTADAPFDKPATIKIPLSQTWDPTDPNPIYEP